MITAGLLALAAAAAIPREGRFDLLCTGSREEAVGVVRGAPASWSGRIAVDLVRGAAHREGDAENLRLKPGPAGRIVLEDDTRGFGDAVVRQAAHVDRAIGAYAARSETRVGDFVLQETTIAAACIVAPFTSLAGKDAPEPTPEPAHGGGPSPGP